MNTFMWQTSDGDFLQSEHWRKFQESVGRKTYFISDNVFEASIIEHDLPIVGKYFYVPRGPVFIEQETVNNEQEDKMGDSSLTLRTTELVDLAKKKNAAWIRIDPKDPSILDAIRKKHRLLKAPHDMQPRELFVIDINKSEEELLAKMKPKTRYNIKLAQKKKVKVIAIVDYNCHPELSEGSNIDVSDAKHNSGFFADAQNDTIEKYLEEFIRLTRITAKRDGITPHPDEYYRKMFETIPSDIIKLYIAEYDGKIIAANIMFFFGKVATYLHGASDNEHRNVMAPFLLQWQAIQDAKKAGCERYDFGGVSTEHESNTNIRINNSWEGITRFKKGFSPETNPTEFCGSWDIVIRPFRYQIYKILSKIRGLV